MPLLPWLAQHFSSIRRVYVLPQILDSFLLAHTLVRHPQRARAMHMLEAEVLSWPGVTAHIHRFGGTEFRVNQREIGHLHGHGLLDILFTKSIRDEVVEARTARPHHIFPQSAWISFDVRTDTNAAQASALLRRNYDRWLALDP
ncbi:MAG: luciferase family protein [Janthinobacterium lividum]